MASMQRDGMFRSYSRVGCRVLSLRTDLVSKTDAASKEKGSTRHVSRFDLTGPIACMLQCRK
jgi:hypothetical protein